MADFKIKTTNGAEEMELADELWRRHLYFTTDGEAGRRGSCTLYVQGISLGKEYKAEQTDTMLRILGVLGLMETVDLIGLVEAMDKIFDACKMGRWFVDVNDLISLYTEYRKEQGLQEADDLIFWVNELIEDYDDLKILERLVIMAICRFRGAPDIVMKTLFSEIEWGMQWIKKGE